MGLTTSKEYFQTAQSIDCSSYDAQLKMKTAIQTITGGGVAITIRGAVGVEGSPKCLVKYTEKNVTTGASAEKNRYVTFSGESVIAGPEVSTVQNISRKTVEDYYQRLRAYNASWNRSTWRTEYTVAKLADTAEKLYNPPRPPWDDTLFEKNIALYNANLREVGKAGGIFDAATASSLDAATFRTNFQRYIAPTPAEPVPLAYRNVIDPRDITNGSGGAAGGAGDGGADAKTTADANKSQYDSLLPPGSPDYDPPTETDDYETILMKFNKAFDIVAAKASGSVSANGTDPSQFDRRLRGRPTKTFVVPQPIIQGFENMTTVTTPKYGFVPFTERQAYLIDYSPSNDKSILRANMCKSLGYLPFNSAYVANTVNDTGASMTEASGCFAKLPESPSYIPRMQTASSRGLSVRPPPIEVITPPAPLGLSPLDTMCGSGSCGPAALPVQTDAPAKATASRVPKKCPETTIKGKTVYVPSKPKNAATSHKIITYRMGTPVGDCPVVGSISADGKETFTGALW
jgi:hypothetical protein